ncbi:TetR/AcrR family transcriptional regulator [Brevibacillus sp. HB1.2]|uniref:TetR/AcrR family transcriptional regulator n=1 Tax=Brevibacillus TaxID=55080 RepID=UPI0004751653|nr:MULTISPECIES: TetR/AcrR family transcriptional regulator [unclassified Brevibacillus]MDC0759649.1 TetR/AcrR family transcriptional regulator [Brevibacillus sp. AG]NRS15271.1 TetR/AcrR family transcriptional regulator [Brevibacillus sp. HB1.4B]NTU19072.1 TetR/AcrR family transcriptional regulator [Brevibacillus sp. HB1.2]NTU29880.1 TetR/AcrR family transcriptional regulator [Brevibacillus sp. HB1.1]
MAEKSIRERIIETSMRLFEANGYHKVTVDQIVKESGTSKGGFYHNFKSKDELLYIIHDQFITYVLEKAEEAYEKWDTPTERLQAIVKSFVMMIDLYRSQVTIFYQESLFLAPEYYTDIETKRDRYKKIMFTVISDGIESGEFRPELPVPIVSMAIFGMVNWIYKWYQKSGTYSIEQIADIYADMVLHSVLKSESMENPAFQRFFLQSEGNSFNPL